MVTGYGVPLEGWAGAVSVPLKVEVEPGPGVRVKGPVVTPLTCADRRTSSVQYLVCRLCCTE